MMKIQVETSDKAAIQTLEIFQFLLSDYHPRNFSLRLWDGSEWPPETAAPRFVLTFRRPGALRRMLRTPATDLYIGHAYIFDDFEIEGDVEAVFALFDYLLDQTRSRIADLQLGWMLFKLPKADAPQPKRRGSASLKGDPHSIKRDRQAVTYHYDVSNDFYAQWLDERMVYSCAYFSMPDDDLDTAQTRKLDYICRKLRLRAGEKLLDIGCGWGGLVIHAAQHYGVEALGITLSQPQADLANQRIQQAGLSDRCRVEICDYRELDLPHNFEKLASIGMAEHVGEALLPVYFEQAWQLLRPGGVFLNHGIAKRASDSDIPFPSFLQHYVFPDAEPVPIHLTLAHAERAGFEVRDVESLREHYTLTLQQWVRRLEGQHQRILEIVDESTYRIWRLFMSGSAHYFATGWVNLYQTLLVKPDQGKSGLPLTRAEWYV